MHAFGAETEEGATVCGVCEVVQLVLIECALAFAMR